MHARSELNLQGRSVLEDRALFHILNDDSIALRQIRTTQYNSISMARGLFRQR